jgi:hypothetical protein
MTPTVPTTLKNIRAVTLINKFLAHPTTLRHVWEHRWYIYELFVDLDHILPNFESRFLTISEEPTVARPTETKTKTLGSGNSTTSPTSYRMWIGEEYGTGLPSSISRKR